MDISGGDPIEMSRGHVSRKILGGTFPGKYICIEFTEHETGVSSPRLERLEFLAVV